MLFENLAGTWVYRSFVNLPQVLPRIYPTGTPREDLERWSGYLFGQGEIELHPGYSGSLSGTLVMRPEWEMDLAGRIVEENGRVLLFWNAIGRKGRESDGWMYEYRGELVPHWPNARVQTDAIVGSVVRTVAHDDMDPLARTDRVARAGSVVSFVMVRKPFKLARDVIPLPEPVLKRFSSKHHRLHHLVWHFARDRWAELKPEQQQDIDRLGWKPPRPNQNPVRGGPAERDPDNGAGEDFLYFHRKMMLEFRKVLADNNLPPIKGWSEIPRASRSADNGDGFAVPPSWQRPKEDETLGFARVKSDEFLHSRMAFLERKFKDPAYLKTLTLDQLGAKIEWTIHAQMHMRWSSLPFDPEKQSTTLAEGRDRFDVSDKWIAPFTGPDGKTAYYDDLFDEFSSNLHPVFWRLHGWIDDRIDDWANAHGNDVTKAPVGGVPWFQRGRPWVAVAEPWLGDTDESHQAMMRMERVLQIILGKEPEASRTTVKPRQLMLSH
jgi:hypothetical protein